jgi:hypothetical protein
MPRQSTAPQYMGLKLRLNQFYDAPNSNVAVSTTINTYTYPLKPSADYPMGYNNSYSGYYFYVNFINSNATRSTVLSYYPTSRSSTSSIGRGYQINTNTYPYFNILTNVNYGYYWSYWSASYPGGPVVSYSQSYNFYYNDTYYDYTIYNNTY